MDCLDPPLDKAPPGQWHCPRCHTIQLNGALDQPDALSHAGPPYLATDVDMLGVPLDSELEVDVETNGENDVDVTNKVNSESDSSSSDSDSDEDTVGAPTPRRPQPVKSKKKRRPTRKSESHISRQPKRMRITVGASPSPLVVRLRIPPKGKGKEREDDIEKNIFEDLLPPSERDISKTSIDGADRTRFDRSRAAAEVRPYLRQCCNCQISSHRRSLHLHDWLTLLTHQWPGRLPVHSAPTLLIRYPYPQYLLPLLFPPRLVQAMSRKVPTPLLGTRSSNSPCAYEPSDLGDMTSIHGTTRHFLRSMPIFPMDVFGYASFV